MEPFSFLDKMFPAEPVWPEEPGPYLFVLEDSGPAERMMLESWIRRNRPESVTEGEVQIAVLPQTRRRRRRRRLDPRLEAFLATGDDPLLVPLRVAWFPSERGGERTVRLIDILIPGDPRDPDPVRQFVIAYTRPDRVRLIAGERSRASWIRKAWIEPGGRGQEEGYSLAEFAALHSWLRLERAEREIRGSRYKVPKFVRESLVENRRFAQGVANLARDEGASYQQMATRTQRYVREIAATHSPYVIDLVAGGFRWLISKAYVEILYDKDELAALYAISQQHPLIFLPSHKSNFDHLVLLHVLYRNGLPPNHTAGGINMNFFPMGPFLRRSGVFFIRRQFKDNEPYKYVLRRYVDYLLEKRFPIEWFIEGGRSRTGKLRPPRLGMLAYVIESYQRGSSDDVVLIPVSIAYDQISDVGSYAAEQAGGAKESESLSWMVRTIRSLRLRYGSAHLRFGAPISLKTFFAGELPEVDADDAHNPAIPKLAFEVAMRINEATPITPITLVTMALLSAGDRALTLDEVMEALRPFAETVTKRKLPTTEPIDAGDAARVRQALESLSVHGVVSTFEGATDTVYRVQPQQHLAAAYYRNTIIHFFLEEAITELALLEVAESTPEDPAHAVVDDALATRDLLKFDFFFSPSEIFAEDVRTILRRKDADFRDRLAAGGARDLLTESRPFRAPAILRPFFEAYQVVGDLIERHAYESTIDAGELAKEAMALGKQYELQGKIRSPESVSSALFDAAIKLAANRSLLEAHPHIVEHRLEFARTLRDLIHRIEVLETIDAARDIGVLD
ncbi:MAG: glycerol-3-phosphate 1-O-acyltransferase [Acidimicrobiia bacterium]|nr:glycerol-3-phosphate 1-O-acyltransferase [Acidimicrobiia bacterium]